jgi:hypothetical protein
MMTSTSRMRTVMEQTRQWIVVAGTSLYSDRPSRRKTLYQARKFVIQVPHLPTERRMYDTV